MKYRLLWITLLAVAFASGVVWAQGAVVESVDEDIVEEVTTPAPSAPAAAPIPASDKSDDKKIAADKDTEKDTVAATVVDTASAVPVKSALDLDALLAEDDHEDDLLVGDKPVIKKTDADSSAVDSLAADKAAGAEAVADGGETVADTAKSAVVARAAIRVDTAAAGKVVIEDGRTINFAQNLKDYRSPRLAMLLSLLVPGLGQAYSRSYIKAGAFAAAEVTAIGVAVYFNSKGKSEKKNAYKFADENFDVNKLKEYGDQLKGQFKDREMLDEDDSVIDENRLLYLTAPFTYYDADFFDAARSRSPSFYESIRDGFFTPGWKDNEPSLDSILKLKEVDFINGRYGRYTLIGKDTIDFYWIKDAANALMGGAPMLGYSRNQELYNSMMDKSSSYHDRVTYTLYVMIVNHIASAIDAGFTARAHNARLLGEEKNVWNRLTVDPQYVFTGSDVSPGITLGVRF